MPVTQARPEIRNIFYTTRFPRARMVTITISPLLLHDADCYLHNTLCWVTLCPAEISRLLASDQIHSVRLFFWL